MKWWEGRVLLNFDLDSANRIYPEVGVNNASLSSLLIWELKMQQLLFL